jgi:hypothetical protein
MAGNRVHAMEINKTFLPSFSTGQMMKMIFRITTGLTMTSPRKRAFQEPG